MKITGTTEEIIHILSNLDKRQRIEVSVNFSINILDTKNVSGRKGTDESKERWPQTDFYKEVQKRLNEKEMNFKELAMAVNTSQSYLSQILHGQKRGKATKKVLEKVSELLEVSVL